MNCIVINAKERLSILTGKVIFEQIEYYNQIKYQENLLKLLREQAEAFVLLWHEDPEIGLRILGDLRQKGSLPAGWRGCVFFRAAVYAGLSNEERVKNLLRQTGFTEKIYVVSSFVSDTHPSDEVLSRFECFVDAVNAMGDDAAPLPFNMLMPPRKGLGISILLLAEHLINEKRLSAEEVIAAMDWPLIIKDGQQAGYSLGLVPGDKAPTPCQIIRYARQYQNLLREEVRWKFNICDQSDQILHTIFLHRVLGPAKRIKNLNNPDTNPEDLTILQEGVNEAIDAINRQLNSLTADTSPYQNEAVGLISQYLKVRSLKVLRELSNLLQELFKAKCHFYINREEIEQQVDKLKKVAAELAAQPATEAQDFDVNVGDAIEAAEKIKTLLQCPCKPNGDEVRLYELTTNINS